MELPRLETLWMKYRDRGLRVIAVEVTGDRQGALRFKDEEGLSFLLAENPEDRRVTQEIFHVATFPTSFLADREGRVIYSHFGWSEGDEEKLEHEILSLLDT